LRALCALALLGAPAGAWAAANEPTVVLLVRHAEKADATDQSPLTADGSRRAVELSRVLKDARLTAIFTSAVRRTKETAAPTAASQHLTPAVLEKEAAAQRAQLLRPGARVLIVGHSNTVPAIIATLGGPAVTIADDEFNGLFILTIPAPAAAGQPAAAAPTLVTLRYGAPNAR
jgi:broad specificity phosphatase PhoE